LRAGNIKLIIVNPVNIGISAGDVTFSVIGDDKARHYVIFGEPIEDLKKIQNVLSMNDLILSSSAWQHCASSEYEYIIKDLHNIKVDLITMMASL
jgi:class 3 adenylate cyclase